MFVKVTICCCHQHHTSLLLSLHPQQGPLLNILPWLHLSVTQPTSFQWLPRPIWFLLSIFDFSHPVLPALALTYYLLLEHKGPQPEPLALLFPLLTMSFPSENPLTNVLSCCTLFLKYHFLVNTGD